MDWAKTTARWDEKHLSFGIWCILYLRFCGNFQTHYHDYSERYPDHLSSMLVQVMATSRCCPATSHYLNQWHDSRVGGCERVFTPIRWRQVRLSCIKWRSTFLYFFRASVVRSAVRPQGGQLLRQLCCWAGIFAQRTHDAKTTSLWRP